MRRIVTAIVVGLVAFGLVATGAGAEPGDLDGAYGNCGFTTLSHGNLSVRPAAVVRQSTGREIVVLHRDSGTEVYGLRNGTLDPSYGTRGVTFIPTFLSMQPPDDRRVWNLAGDRLVIYASSGSANALVALDRDGRIDETYGNHGVAETGRARPAAAVLSDGSFIVADAPQENATQELFRITPTGQRDPSYAPVPPSVGGINRIGLLEATANGDLYLVAGSDLQFGGGFEGHDIWRLTASGVTDLTFHITIPLPPSDQAVNRVGSITPVGTGLLLLTSSYDPASPTPYVSTMQRFDHTGALDPSFGNGGSATASNLPATMIGVAVRPGGGIVVTGRSTNPVNGYVDDFAAAYTADGVLIPGGFRALDIGGAAPDFDVDTHGLVTRGGYATFGVANGYPDSASGVARVRFDALRQGAGLVLQWNGDAWPTRFGSDPGPECPYNTPYWPEDDLARGITTVNGKGGYVADAYGGIHRFSFGLQHSRPPKAIGGPYWPGWDITRGIASKPDGTGGYVLDAYGGVHPFATGLNPYPAPIVNGPYWPGWNITRGIALMPDGNRGYILDGFGGIHPFSTPGHAMPPALNHTAYWPGWDIARGISVLPDGTGGWIVDAYGGAHPFGIGAHAPPPGPGPNAPYAAGEDWVRGYTFIAPKVASSGVAGNSRTQHDPSSTNARPAHPRPRDPSPRGPVSTLR